MVGKSFDAIIVLGAGITPKGNLSRVAKSRMDMAVELYMEGVAPRIIVTGRKESAVMKRYAVRKGVSPAHVLLEARALDTIGNAFFTRKLFLQPNRWRSVIVVTSLFHLYRAKLVFQKVLGSGFRVAFAAARRVLSDKAFREKVKQEQGLVMLTRILSALVADGDMLAVENFLRNSPVYKAYGRVKG